MRQWEALIRTRTVTTWGAAPSWSWMLAGRNSLLSRERSPGFPPLASENWSGLRASGVQGIIYMVVKLWQSIFSKILEYCDEFVPGEMFEYFFDKNPENFTSILNIYRTGAGILFLDVEYQSPYRFFRTPYNRIRMCFGVRKRFGVLEYRPLFPRSKLKWM